MQRLAFALLLLGACGVDQRPGMGGGDDDDPPATTTDELGQVGTPGRLAVVGDLVVVAGFGGVEAIPLAGGAGRVLAAADPDRYFIEPVADGDGIVIATLATSFGPDGDRTMHIDRVGLDGSRATIGQAFAGYGAGEGLAVVGDKVVFSTGGSADLLAVPRAGGNLIQLASDSGNFGDVVAIGTMAYYVNGWTVYSHDMTTSGSDHGIAFSGVGLVDTATMATDGVSTIVAIGASLEDPTKTLVNIVSSTTITTPPPAIAPLAGMAGDIAVADDVAFAIAGGGIFRIDLATSETTTFEDAPADAAAMVVDLAIAGDRLVWITLDGKLHARVR